MVWPHVAWRILISALCTVCLTFPLVAQAAQSIPPITDESPPEIVKNDAWVDFPQAVEFHLMARAASAIVKAELEYGVLAQRCGPVSNTTALTFTPSPDLDVSWRWEITPEWILPPGATLWWQWRLETETGANVTTPRQTTAFNDHWFVWQLLEAGNLRLHWYRGPHTLADEVLAAARQGLAQLSAETGLQLDEPVDLYLYDEPEALRQSVPGAPAWIGGIAFPEYNTVMLVAGEDTVEYGRRTVRHELGHLVVERLTFNCRTTLPVWLNEGLAMVAEGEDPAATATLAQARAENRLLTLRQIESSFSVYANRASLSYAESYSLVRFLNDTYGQERMLTLLSTFRAGVAVDEALNRTYGFDTAGLEARWREAMGALPMPAETAAVSSPTALPTLALATLPPPLVTATSTALPTVQALPTVLVTPAPVVSAKKSLSLVGIVGGCVLGMALLAGVLVWRRRS